MEKRFDVAALGEAMLEFNQTRPGEPQYLQGFGGDTSNAVIAAARAGARTAYLTRLGRDTFGDALEALWRHEGVDTSGVERDDTAPTGIYFVTHGPSGHEFTYRRAGSAASRMTPAWLPRALLCEAKILHVSGISLAISASARETVFQAMAEARNAGVLVSLDSNLRLKLWSLDEARATLTRAIGLSDFFLPSVDDVNVLSGHEDPSRIVQWSHELGAKQVVLKLGADGALVSDGQGAQSIPGFRVEVVDATGAGDCFCGNLLARLASGESVFDAARYANAAAALAVQGFGAVASLPRPEQVRELL
ncbi:sugar kinase [Caenimonas sedimenti]|uniref:Sugar kinase n=1 Tax=Caenimonas sedimenti TaxID=2596921 RepID=A0A562ZXR5_9BURK|nr:sugar kinase [Caenimonas sedimenti]TWO73075.1 sugar kinase [Caenimonas sedimenti]